MEEDYLEQLQQNSLQSVLKNQSFDIIRDFDINFNLSFLRSNVSNEVKELQPSTMLDGQIQVLNLILTQDIYNKLLGLSESLKVPDIEVPEKAVITYKELKANFKQLRKVGPCYVKSFNKWEKYNGVLHGSYLYLFKNARDETPA